ncbi:MAG: amidohydrolase family protein, partial [Patescibacteria group bacterium]
LNYDVPVIFHSGDTLAGYVKNPKIKYSHPLHVDEVATDFPNLKIVMAHMGNPWLVDCAEILYKNPNVYADISGLVVGDNLNTPDGKLARRKILELIDYVGQNKLLYGTDWPLAPMRTYLKFVKELGLSRASRDQLLYKNAVKVFGLNL